MANVTCVVSVPLLSEARLPVRKRRDEDLISGSEEAKVEMERVLDVAEYAIFRLGF